MVDIEALQKYSFFGGLLPDQIGIVRGLLGFQSFDEGTEIVAEGKDNDRIYFILEGRVLVSKRDRPIAEIGEGEIFGQMEILEVMPSTASVRALSPLKTAVLTSRSLYRLSHEDIRVFAITMMNLARDLSRHLRRMDELMAKG